MARSVLAGVVALILAGAAGPVPGQGFVRAAVPVGGQCGEGDQAAWSPVGDSSRRVGGTVGIPRRGAGARTPQRIGATQSHQTGHAGSVGATLACNGDPGGGGSGSNGSGSGSSDSGSGSSGSGSGSGSSGSGSGSSGSGSGTGSSGTGSGGNEGGNSGNGGGSGANTIGSTTYGPGGGAEPQQIVALVQTQAPGGADALARNLATRYGLRIVSAFPLSSLLATMVVFSVPVGRSAETTAVDLRQEQGVVESDTDSAAMFVTLGSPLVSEEYALPLIGVQRAQSVVRGRDVLIGIVDTGIDLSHPDLRGAVVDSENLVDAREPMSPGAHGTAIAGIIAGQGADGGVVGIAPAAKLVAIEACALPSAGSAEAVCAADRVARGIDLAVGKGVQILNLSFGGPPNTVVDRMVLQAILVHHVIVVAAAGNNGPHGPLMYPAALPGVIAVGASDNRDMLDAHSNLGPNVSLLAPGVDVMTTLPENRYAFVSGTSYAAAVTSGALALLIEAGGSATPLEAIAALRGGADPIQIPGERLGRVNVCRSLSLLGRADICTAVPGAHLRPRPHSSPSARARRLAAAWGAPSRLCVSTGSLRCRMPATLRQGIWRGATQQYLRGLATPGKASCPPTAPAQEARPQPSHRHDWLRGCGGALFTQSSGARRQPGRARTHRGSHRDDAPRAGRWDRRAADWGAGPCAHRRDGIRLARAGESSDAAPLGQSAGSGGMSEHAGGRGRRAACLRC